jgi:hypothetical protein
MNFAETISQLAHRLTDWIYSLLVIIVTLSVALIWWGHFEGIGGFVQNFFGILATPLPVPFWALVLLGVGLSITIYRKRATYKEFLGLTESTPQE